MTPAFEAVAAFGLGPYGLHRLEALIASADNRTIAMIQRVEFTHEATLRDRFMRPDGIPEDAELYARLAIASTSTTA